MLKLVLEYTLRGLRTTWKLYLANILALLVILLLFSYLEGARRQLDLRNTVFSGETVVKFKVALPDVEGTLRAGVPGISGIYRKLRSPVTYKTAGGAAVGDAELLGADLRSGGGGDLPLRSWLEIVSGALPGNEGEILVPESFARDVGLAVGDGLGLQGRTSANELNSAALRICGIYRSAELGSFDPPRLIARYGAVDSFLDARPQDVEYCLFFEGGKAPANINASISKSFDDAAKRKVQSIASGKVSVFDVLNVSVQFNVFLVIVVYIVIAVLATVVLLVNFNIFTIVFRKREKELGTLLAFGAPPAKIAFALVLESFLQVLICTAAASAICLALSAVASRVEMGGSLALLLTLLSGTNRLELSMTFSQVRTCFYIVAAAVTLAQVPLALRVLSGDTAAFLRGRR